MKLWIPSLCLALATSAQAAPRSPFLGQLPKELMSANGQLNFSSVAQAFEKASPDVQASDFEANNTYRKFRLTAESQQRFGDERNQEEPVFPELIGRDERDPDTICRTVDRDGSGHVSYVFRNIYRNPDREFVFSAGPVSGQTQIPSSSGAEEFMIGRADPADGYVIHVLKNDFGFYSDYPAPVSVVYRRGPSILIAAFRKGSIPGYKVCWSSTRAACQVRGAAKGRYDEPAESFVNVLNLIVTGEDVKTTKRNASLEAKRRLGCLAGENETIAHYVDAQCSEGSKTGACVTAKNACAAYAQAKKDMQCGNDLSRMNFYAYNPNNGQWLEAAPY